MCDYSLHHVNSRAARAADKLTSHDFGTGTTGFAAAHDRSVAVCVLPGTELGFAAPVRIVDRRFFMACLVETIPHATAVFRQVNKAELSKHHDALEFPDGRIVLLTELDMGQEAVVLQLPAMPKSSSETETQKRVAYAK